MERMLELLKIYEEHKEKEIIPEIEYQDEFFCSIA